MLPAELSALSVLLITLPRFVALTRAQLPGNTKRMPKHFKTILMASCAVLNLLLLGSRDSAGPVLDDVFLQGYALLIAAYVGSPASPSSPSSKFEVGNEPSIDYVHSPPLLQVRPS